MQDCEGYRTLTVAGRLMSYGADIQDAFRLSGGLRMKASKYRLDRLSW
jgi:hypothetical protein